MSKIQGLFKDFSKLSYSCRIIKSNGIDGAMVFCQNNNRSLLEIDTNEKYIYFRLNKCKNQSLVQITEYNRDISYAWFKLLTEIRA